MYDTHAKRGHDLIVIINICPVQDVAGNWVKLASSAEAFTSAFVAGAAIAFISRRWEHFEPLAFLTTRAGSVFLVFGSGFDVNQSDRANMWDLLSLH